MARRNACSGADCEHLGPAAHQQHLLVAAMADKLAAVGKIGEQDALDQIRSVWLGMTFSHCLLLGDPESNCVCNQKAGTLSGPTASEHLLH